MCASELRSHPYLPHGLVNVVQTTSVKHLVYTMARVLDVSSHIGTEFLTVPACVPIATGVMTNNRSDQFGIIAAGFDCDLGNWDFLAHFLSFTARGSSVAYIDDHEYHKHNINRRSLHVLTVDVQL